MTWETVIKIGVLMIWGTMCLCILIGAWEEDD